MKKCDLLYGFHGNSYWIKEYSFVKLVDNKMSPVKILRLTIYEG